MNGDYCVNGCSLKQQLDKLKQTLAEIKEIAERAKKDMVIDPTVDDNAASTGNSKKNPLIFTTVEEAFAWLYANNSAIENNPSIVPDKIKKKIIAASANGTTYCGKFWRIG